MKRLFLGLPVIIISCHAFAHRQEKTHDSIPLKTLDSVTVTATWKQLTIKRLPDIQGGYIFGGKKTEVINMSQLPADISNKTGRQVFAKVPGIFVYDMDGAGNQINIAARGLDPHRGWEFNIRKDGIITNSDMYGYPASHFSMPLESIERIELVRGTGSLQYGAQFGGMLNYVTKQGDTARPFSFESINTVGSFNLVSSYNAIGGKAGKLRYYAYLYKKSRNGYRDNEHTNSQGEAIAVTYEPNKNFSIRVEWARSQYRYRIPGSLTDSMFNADPKQATRARNYFNPDIHVPSVTLHWQIATQTRLQLTSSAVLGKRSSVQFDKPANIRDTINAFTLQFNNRQVDIDRFNSYTTEWRLLHHYLLGNQTSSLAAGVQYMNNDLHRTQLGKGTTGGDYDLALVDPVWGRDVHLKTRNLAVFFENKFQLLPNLFVNAGARFETGKTDMSGTITYYPDNAIPLSIKHRFPLLGINASYNLKENMEVYAGWSQAFRPMLFKDLIPSSLFEKVDPDIEDARGYNAEAGFRGTWKFLRWDISGFLLQYNNRFGVLAETDNSGNFYTYRTNIGNSVTRGAEIFVQADWFLNKKVALSVFTSTAFIHARYGNATLKSGNANINIHGNKVESAPDIITRNGVTVRVSNLSFSVLYSYTGKTFADALNTVVPPANTGAVGLVPSYGILDLNASFRISKNLEAKMNVSNVTDKQYFTKRPTFYPGPGIWPSDGRNYGLTLGIHL
ncbi:MAG: TonB-dependent receptor [Chitinophagaceae bacterium]|nr:TonB-dependent receptor [Chitinophagaceae bacterium]